MNINTTLSKGLWLELNERRAARAGIFLLLWLALPAVAQAQFNYTNNGDGTITITGYTGPGGAVTIPDTINGLPVTAIGGYLDVGGQWQGAFYQCTCLTSVTIPTSVTSIGDRAFEQCTHLTNVTIPNSVTNIGYAAFGGCTSVTIVTIPNSITSIADATFEACHSLANVTIPNSVTNIGGSAFGGCYSLTNVTIPSSVTSIGSFAFSGCTSMSAITVEASNPEYSSVDGVLFNKSRTTLIQCPGGKTGSYSIPNSVTNFNDAFRFCFHLTSITIPDTISKIGDWSFQECLSLTNVTIPNSVTSIGDFAIHRCTSLTGVTIPNSVTSIGDNAFDSSTSLTSVTIPDSVTHLGSSIFRFCSSLSAINVEASNPAYRSVDGVLFNKSQTSLIECPGAKAGSYTIPNSVTSIADDAFDSCARLTSVTLPNRITNIGVYTFYNCTSLTSVTIGTSVTHIGDWVFNFCINLTGVYFLGNAPSLGSSVFDANANPTIYYLPGTTGWGATFGGRPTTLWTQVPTIHTPPQTQTAEAGSAVGLRVRASSPLPLFYFWNLNATNLLSSGTNWQLELPNVQFAQSGAYTVVVSNLLGAITSAPALLNVIAPVERRPVPGVRVTGETASLLHVDCADSLSPAPNWTTIGSVSLTSTSQYYFDLTLPLPPQRFYRAWQTGTSGVLPFLDLHLVPAITLTGNIGHSVRLDYINRFGPIDAWVTLDTVTLTNASQLYFDVSAPGQPPRLYRLVPSP